MKRLAPILLALALVVGCGSDVEPESDHGLTAAADCLGDGGATTVIPSGGDLQKNVAAKGPGGTFISLTTSDADTVIIAARKMRTATDTDLVTWLTPDHQAFAAVEGTDKPEDWRLAVECALVLPDDPGKGNQEMRLDEMHLNTEYFASVVDGACDLKPGRMSSLLLGDAVQRDIGPKRWDGYMNRMAARAADLTLDPRTRGETCRMLRRAKPWAV